jgi:AAA domain
MVGMISAIGEGMIVTAPSNAAVANLAVKVVASGRFAFPNVCIFGDGCDQSVRFLNPRYRSDEYKKALEKCLKLDEVAIPPHAVKMIENREREKNSIRQKLAEWLHVEDSLSMRELRTVCPNISLDKTGSVSKEGRRNIAMMMGSAQVLLCTLNSSGSYYFQDAVSGSRFQTLLLDEGGQCTEAEFFIATTFPGIKRIIVMGDPKQLRPTVLEPACSSAGYGESWLGRVYKIHPSKMHLLDTQYRMDPAILRFPNQRFYSKRIKSGDNVKVRCPPVENPFLFIDTQGRGREERDETLSYRNSYEIAVIRDVLKNDSDIAGILRANPHSRIIIITPYKAQVALLQEMGRSLKFINPEVSTVDAFQVCAPPEKPASIRTDSKFFFEFVHFQGQEGDIVILSTVRTKRVGFVDDGQRLNVALTRAKRVLRVVGDRNFFMNLHAGSTLRALATYATNAESFQATKMRSIPTCPPDLSIQTRWKITLTQRFHHAMGSLPKRSRHVLLNTLFALALPDLNALGSPVVEKEGWHTSHHRGFPDMRVIWVARNHEGVGIVEAHFGGTRDECLRFRQINHLPPDGCCAPISDMSGVVTNHLPPPEIGRMLASWSLDRHLQNAILSNNVIDLPLSMIQLDPPQERIARSPPPLLIESRSGTGKTLVLLQHAAFYHRASDTRPACFITVSPRLRNELEQRYEELTPIHGAGLPKTRFFSFRDFITGLLSHFSIEDFDDKDKCTFQGYTMARRSHKKLDIEAHLLENEIGGVIMGSVVAAQQGEALDRQQYLKDKRSNIPNKMDEGRARRDVVFDEFERYKEWKCTTRKYDIHEAVLRLQQENPQQLFSSGKHVRCSRSSRHVAVFCLLHTVLSLS